MSSTVPVTRTASEASALSAGDGRRPTAENVAEGSSRRISGSTCSTKYRTPSSFGSQSIEPVNTMVSARSRVPDGWK